MCYDVMEKRPALFLDPRCVKEEEPLKWFSRQQIKCHIRLKTKNINSVCVWMCDRTRDSQQIKLLSRSQCASQQNGRCRKGKSFISLIRSQNNSCLMDFSAVRSQMFCCFVSHYSRADHWKFYISVTSLSKELVRFSDSLLHNRPIPTADDWN